jgi:hypothetical protein
MLSEVPLSYSSTVLVHLSGDILMPQHLNSQENKEITEIIRHHIMDITAVRTENYAIVDKNG